MNRAGDITIVYVAYTIVYVAFDNEAVGKETAKSCEDLKDKFGVQTIPIRKYEAEYNIGKLGMGSKATALQFPLKLSTACTCHKVGSLFYEK